MAKRMNKARKAKYDAFCLLLRKVMELYDLDVERAVKLLAAVFTNYDAQ